MGKWSLIAKTLPRREEAEGSFRTIVNDLKDESRVLSLDALAEKYRIARKEKEVLEKVESGINARIAALEALISETFLAESRDKPFYFTDGSRIEVSDQISVRAADQDAVSDWARSNGYERMLTMNAKRLEGLTKAALEAGQAIPEGVVVTAYSMVKFSGK